MLNKNQSSGWYGRTIYGNKHINFRSCVGKKIIKPIDGRQVQERKAGVVLSLLDQTTADRRCSFECNIKGEYIANSVAAHPHIFATMNDPENLVRPYMVSASRDKRLPVFYQVNSHPLVPEPQTGRIFVYEQDTDKKTMNKFLEYAKTVTVPKGTNAQIDKQGKHRTLQSTVYASNDDVPT